MGVTANDERGWPRLVEIEAMSINIEISDVASVESFANWIDAIVHKIEVGSDESDWSRAWDDAEWAIRSLGLPKAMDALGYRINPLVFGTDEKGVWRRELSKRLISLRQRLVGGEAVDSDIAQRLGDPPTELMKKIWAALDGCSLTKEKLAAKILVDPSRLSKANSDLKKMVDAGLIKNAKGAGRGYFRPDAISKL